MLIWILEDDSRRIDAMTRATQSLHVRTCVFRSAQEFIAALDTQRPLPEVISLDHDLHTPSNIDLGSGTDVATRLALLPPFANVVIASTNVQASERMASALTEAGWPVERLVPHDDLTWVKSWREILRRWLADSSETRLSSGPVPLILRVDGRTRALLETSRDLVILGVIDIDSELSLFESTPVADAGRWCFPCHSDLLGSGIVQRHARFGFSVILRRGKLRFFNRLSALNARESRSVMPSIWVADILELTRWPLDEQFRLGP